MTDSHPDLAALEALRTGEATAEEANHVKSCPGCRTAFEELKQLAGRLEGLSRPRVEVPASVRSAIRDRAARSLSRPRRVWVPLAAAAALLAGVVAVWTSQSSERLPGDVDGSGRVDIVDAYSLAVSIRSGEAGSDHDLTGDGRVDADDVDEIARLSVSLGEGGER